MVGRRHVEEAASCIESGARLRKARWMFGFVVLLFGVLFAGLYRLQVVDGERYRRRSRQNTMQTVVVPAVRGRIRDRNGVVLVDNRPLYTVTVEPSQVSRTSPEQQERIAATLGRALGLPVGRIRPLLSSHRHAPKVIKRGVGFQAVSVLEEDRYDLQGVAIEVETTRDYPKRNGPLPLAPHLLGYVGKVDSEALLQTAPGEYRYDDWIGRRGVEQLCEDDLRGDAGVRYVEVNAHGREVGDYPDLTQQPLPGADVTLTIDWRLQMAAEQAFGDTLRGSLVAMDPVNGEVLAMVSKPGFDLQSIRDPAVWHSVRHDPGRPLLDRSLQGEYPAGSILKPVLAAAGVDLGLASPDLPRFGPCEPEIPFSDRVFKCHYGGKHGEVTLRQALVQSCNVYFYHLGQAVGIDMWRHYATLLGLGQPTGIDMGRGPVHESRGRVPTRAFYESRGGFTDGVLLNLAIGQGETLVTPLQVARYISGIAVGSLPSPHVLMGTTAARKAAPVGISVGALEALRSMLVDVVASPAGTGKEARIAGLRIAGKTGTAQTALGQDDAWFMGFAPAESPSIAIAVVVENGGSGGAVAAPIARELLEAYFSITGALHT